MDGLCYENKEFLANYKKNSFIRTNFPTQKCNVILRKRQTHSDLAEYLHAACFGPVQSTFTKAIQQEFQV